MQRPYLIQRLKAPHQHPMANAFAFGGGKVNGGISPEAMALLRGVFSFDYMGSAEFEWGAVPTAFTSLFTNPSIIKFSMDIAGKEVHIICPSSIEADVIAWLALAAKGKYNNLKERLGFKEALSGDKYADYKGWIKIEEDRRCKEPFMFFIDKNMFENVCNLFGI